MRATGDTSHTHCIRCGRILRAAASVRDGAGRWCKARIRAAIIADALKGFTQAQADKARELIADGGIVAIREGIYRARVEQGRRVLPGSRIGSVLVSCRDPRPALLPLRRCASHGRERGPVSMTVRDICGNADLFRAAYPSWPHAEPDRATAPVLSEITIGWGDDTFCAQCLCALPAGAPAWAEGDSPPLCADCTS